jgi:hypothetical protein
VEVHVLTRIVLGLVAIFALVVFCFSGLLAWGLFFGQSSCGATLANGRTINASADCCYIGVESTPDTATIRTFRKTVWVSPTELRVNDCTVEIIPANTKSLDVIIRDGEVSFIADGKPLGFAHR